MGTDLKRSTTYHPQTDGQTEVLNRSLETYLRCFVSTKSKEWVKWLPWSEYWHNTSYHSSIGMTPFKVIYGRDPPRLIHYDKGNVTTLAVDRFLIERDQVLSELKFHLSRAQDLIIARADGKRRDLEFSVGEMAYLKLRPYRQSLVALRVNQKIAPRFYGPVEVLEKIGSVAYVPNDLAIHNVFHISQLKKVVGNVAVESVLPVYDAVGESVKPGAVLGVRIKDGNQEVLIAWKGMLEEEVTWENYDHILGQFPSFNLEDKLVVRDGGNDMNHVAEDLHSGRFSVNRKKKKNGPMGPGSLS